MMRFGEVLRLVWINLIGNRNRMLMTSLGIVVGAATIVLVIAVGQGGQADVADQFKNLNAGAIEVTATDEAPMGEMMDMMGGGMPGGGGGVPSFGGGGGGMPSFGGGGMPGGGGGGGGGGASSLSGTRMTEEDVEDLKELVPNLAEVTILMSGDIEVFGGELEEAVTATVVGAQEAYQDVSNLSRALRPVPDR